MRFSDIEKHLSVPRLNRYLIAASGDKRKAIKAYKLNLELAQSFHPLLGILEVVLRNHINQQLSNYFHDNNWIINEKSGFMSSRSLRGTNFFLKGGITKAEKRLRKNRVTITSGKIIAEQTFGFWTALFEVHHYRLIGGRPIKAFKHLPTQTGRKAVFKELEKIREFRNRINHNEPICFNVNSLDFTTAEEISIAIRKILSWIDPQILDLYNSLDKTVKVIAKCKSI